MYEKKTVGLFGTCDGTDWRPEFTQLYDTCGVTYFNPLRDDWSHENIPEENWHLNNDKIILFPVLSRSPGLGSLGEVGFSCAHCVSNPNHHLIAIIDDTCTSKNVDSAVASASKSPRALVKSKLQVLDNKHKNIHLVDTLDNMLTRSLQIIFDKF